ncbi:MAG: hypothetical protein KatS3mg115_2599 [Candidatus Poribacteria bacterium]|nr:MAG: hypothetical protein KatS3mg115_2599 [Candidatus Poribacteria bacterium]
MSVPDRKAQRTALRRLRRALPESLRRSWSQQIQEAAWRLLTDRGIFVLFAYWSVREEVQTDALMRRWLREGRTLVLARPDPSSKTMSLYRIAALEAVEPGPWGIAQPRQDLGAPVDPKTVSGSARARLGI